jgi:plasmid replication initiation protein
MVSNRKANKVYEELASRQNYLVVQANDLAKAFGNLKAFEHKVLDFCFSSVTKESKPTDTFQVHSLDIMKHFGLTRNGQNYKRIAEAFAKLNENTALYIPETLPDGRKSIIMTQLFSRIRFIEDGMVEFKFSEDVAPLVFELKNNYYSFQLAELARIKSKYALILMKLWEAKRFGKQQVTTIQGSLDDWQDWFLGEEKRWTAGLFKRNALLVACDELEEKLKVSITLTTIKRGRKVIGYEMQLVDNRQVTTAELIKEAEKNSYQTDIYDFIDEEKGKNHGTN